MKSNNTTDNTEVHTKSRPLNDIKKPLTKDNRHKNSRDSHQSDKVSTHDHGSHQGSYKSYTASQVTGSIRSNTGSLNEGQMSLKSTLRESKIHSLNKSENSRSSHQSHASSGSIYSSGIQSNVNSQGETSSYRERTSNEKTTKTHSTNSNGSSKKGGSKIGWTKMIIPIITILAVLGGILVLVVLNRIFLKIHEQKRRELRRKFREEKENKLKEEEAEANKKTSKPSGQPIEIKVPDPVNGNNVSVNVKGEPLNDVKNPSTVNNNDQQNQVKLMNQLATQMHASQILPPEKINEILKSSKTVSEFLEKIKTETLASAKTNNSNKVLVNDNKIVVDSSVSSESIVTKETEKKETEQLSSETSKVEHNQIKKTEPDGSSTTTGISKENTVLPEGDGNIKSEQKPIIVNAQDPIQNTLTDLFVKLLSNGGGKNMESFMNFQFEATSDEDRFEEEGIEEEIDEEAEAEDEMSIAAEEGERSIDPETLSVDEIDALDCNETKEKKLEENKISTDVKVSTPSDKANIDEQNINNNLLTNVD